MKSYAVSITALIAVTQFVIFLLDLQFNSVLVETFKESKDRAQSFADLYQKINIMTLIIQVIGVPLLFRWLSVAKVFIFIPLVHIIVIVSSSLFFVDDTLAKFSFLFIFFKSIDYSLFSMSKEVMYSGLTQVQKFGMKYLADIFIYRLSKALIALVLTSAALRSLLNGQTFFMISIVFLLVVWMLLAWACQKKTF